MDDLPCELGEEIFSWLTWIDYLNVLCSTKSLCDKYSSSRSKMITIEKRRVEREMKRMKDFSKYWVKDNGGHRRLDVRNIPKRNGYFYDNIFYERFYEDSGILDEIFEPLPFEVRLANIVKNLGSFSCEGLYDLIKSCDLAIMELDPGYFDQNCNEMSNQKGEKGEKWKKSGESIYDTVELILDKWLSEKFLKLVDDSNKVLFYTKQIMLIVGYKCPKRFTFWCPNFVTIQDILSGVAAFDYEEYEDVDFVFDGYDDEIPVLRLI